MINTQEPSGKLGQAPEELAEGALAIGSVIGLASLFCPPCAVIGAAAAVGSIAMGGYKIATGRPHDGIFDIALAGIGGVPAVASRLFRAGASAMRVVNRVTKPGATLRRDWRTPQRTAGRAAAEGVLIASSATLAVGMAKYTYDRNKTLHLKTYAPAAGRWMRKIY